MGRVLSALACERVGPVLLTGGSNPNADYLVYNICNKLNFLSKFVKSEATPCEKRRSRKQSDGKQEAD